MNQVNWFLCEWCCIKFILCSGFNEFMKCAVRSDLRLYFPGLLTATRCELKVLGLIPLEAVIAPFCTSYINACFIYWFLRFNSVPLGIFVGYWFEFWTRAFSLGWQYSSWWKWPEPGLLYMDTTCTLRVYLFTFYCNEIFSQHCIVLISLSKLLFDYLYLLLFPTKIKVHQFLKTSITHWLPTVGQHAQLQFPNIWG